MNKRNKSLYNKAMKYYEQGKINRALEVCELILANNLENAAVLNFKGLLLYQKGDLNGAMSIWKLNYDMNHDKFAYKYMEDARQDVHRLELYKEGENYLKQLKIDSALEKLNQCAQSDFNTIRVNSALAIAYQKKGEFILAKQYVEKALKIDCNYATAKKVKNELIEIGMYKDEERNNNSTKAIGVLTGIVILIFVCMGSYMAYCKYDDNKKAQQLQAQREEEAQNKLEMWNEIEAKKEADKEEKKENFKEDSNEEVSNVDSKASKLDVDKVNSYIENNDYYGIYDEINKTDNNALSKEDKVLYDKSVEILKNQGVEKFYEDGVENFKQEKYDYALSDFNKAYDYCKESYLDEHVIFYKARTLLEKGDKKGAIKSYKEYYDKYPESTYTSGVLYQLALLTYENDITESTDYANKLMDKYPKSIYINDRIKSILNS